MYKTNTPTYSNKNIKPFSDFQKEVEIDDLKSMKRGFDRNSDVKQKYPKNSKLRFNKITRKMDDVATQEINDKISKLSESSTGVNIASMSRFIDDYSLTHDSFEKRGMDEGIEILRNSDSIETAISNINSRIADLESKKTFGKDGIIVGLNDLVKNLESKLVSESRIDSDMLIRLTNRSSYKKLVSDIKIVLDEYIESIADIGFDEGDSDHQMALSTAASEAMNTALKV